MESTSLTITATFHGQERYNYPEGCTFTTHLPNVFEATHSDLVERFVDFLRTMGYSIPGHYVHTKDTPDAS